MAYAYDDQNIFAKILRGEIPNQTVLEDEYALAFNDIAPQTPNHVLVIPKGPYVNFDHFAAQATDAEIAGFTRAVGQVCQILGVQPGDGGQGYRLVSNSGDAGVQEVPHMHVHLLAGRIMDPMVAKPA